MQRTRIRTAIPSTMKALRRSFVPLNEASGSTLDGLVSLPPRGVCGDKVGLVKEYAMEGRSSRIGIGDGG